ncbi:hypothetical protein [Paenibacillus sp. SYP-B3998]|nr:hypothetical protein [Paenibacillus sp. SYP-B3998]
MTKWIGEWDLNIGIVVFFILMIPFYFMLKWPHQPFVLYVGFMVMLIGKFIYARTTDPLFGPDAKHYFGQVSFYPQLTDFMQYATDHITTNWLNSSAYPVFGLLYMPYFKFLNMSDPLVIITFNSFLLIVCCNMTYRLNEKFFTYELPEVRTNTYHAVLIIGLLASPAFMYMSSVFGKDITCALLGLLCTQLLLNRKYLLFLIVLFYASMLRDYSIVYILSFYFLFRRSLKSAIAMLLTAMGVVLWKVGTVGLLNAFLLTLFLFISPNPSKAMNWDVEYIMRTLEAVYMMVTLGMSVIVWFLHKETRSFYTMCLLLLFTFGCTLVLVGYMTVTERDLDYGVGTVGDNMVRKKVPILPILYMMNAYTLAWLTKSKASYSKRGGAYDQGQGQVQSIQNHVATANRYVNRPAKAASHLHVEGKRSAAGESRARAALLSSEKIDCEMRR